MSLLDYLIPFIGALAILIVIHELGHFLVARWCGVKVLRFSRLRQGAGKRARGARRYRMDHQRISARRLCEDAR